MATFLDIGILENFSIIFVFLLVFSVIYALLMFAKPFGKEAKGLYAIIALAIGFLVIMSKSAVVMINFMTPWFLVAVLFVFFLLIIIGMFGGDKLSMIKVVSDPNVYAWIIVIAVVILIFGLSHTMGQALLEEGTGGNQTTVKQQIETGGSTQTGSFSQNLINTLFHPKILGLLLVMLIGTFALVFLTKVST